MANWQVISLDTTTPQLRAPGTGDGYSFNSGSTQLGVWTTTGLGIGTASPTARLHVEGVIRSQSAGADSIFEAVAPNDSFAPAVRWAVSGIRNSGILGFPAGEDALVYRSQASSFSTGTERFRITVAGNVGIGTSSPAQRLDVTGAVNSVQARFGNVAGRGLTIGTTTNSGTNDAAVVFNAPTTEGAFFFQTVSDTKMTLSTSGNLGVGTSTTTNGRLNVQAGTAATGNSAFFTNLDGTYNAYLQIQHSSAGVKLFNGNSFGAAANNLIFGNSGVSEIMRLDGSGNVGIGTTSPVGKLHVLNSSGITLTLEKSSGAALQFVNSGGNGYQIDDSSGALRWLSSGTTERMRLDSSGNVGIGTTSPTQKLEVVGGIASTGTDAFLAQRALVPSGVDVGAPPLSWRFYTTGTTYTIGAMIQGLSAGAWSSTSAPTDMRFYTVPSGSTTLVERARIPAAGGVVVGTAALATNATDGFLYIPGCAGTPTGTPTAYTGRVPLVVDTTNNKLYFYSSGAWRDAGP